LIGINLTSVPAFKSGLVFGKTLYASPMQLAIRPAVAADVPTLETLIEASVRGLQSGDYTPAQIERALRSVYGVDTQLIEDGTYFVAEVAGAGLKACGGWSKRKTLFGSDRFAGREDALLDPNHEAAKIRAFFVHPEWSRRGIASRLLETCESAAADAGFHRLEMGSTLTGVFLYRARGYIELERCQVPLGDGVALSIVRMEKPIVARRSS
jgi:GNAT superfamily N-acetyltransferase